jgi:F-type H+-transporting ATPase subunit alpha
MVREFEKNFLDHMETHHRAELDLLREGKLTDEVTQVLEKVCSDMTATYA